MNLLPRSITIQPTTMNTSPTNAEIFALVQSRSNVQTCDDYKSARYVAKYAAGVETREIAKKFGGKDRISVKVILESIQNEKIAGVKKR